MLKKKAAPQWLINYIKALIIKSQYLYTLSKNKKDWDAEFRRSHLNRAKMLNLDAMNLARAFISPEIYERFSSDATRIIN